MSGFTRHGATVIARSRERRARARRSAARRIRVSNPDKPYFPERGSPRPTSCATSSPSATGSSRRSRDRPTMLERWPGGMAGRAIFQRRFAQGVPDWVRADARRHLPDRAGGRRVGGEPRHAALPSLAGPPRGDPAHPDELRIDLDPQPGTGFRDAVGGGRRAARPARRARPDRASRRRRAAAGVHVTVPIAPRWSWDDGGARAGGARARARAPACRGAATTARLKRDRGARVYVDHGQFLVAAAYSIRPAAARDGVGARDLGRARDGGARGLRRHDDAGALRRARRPPRRAAPGRGSIEGLLADDALPVMPPVAPMLAKAGRRHPARPLLRAQVGRLPRDRVPRRRRGARSAAATSGR